MFSSSEYHERSGSGPILPEVAIESRSTTLKSFDLSRKSGTCKVDNLPHPFEVSNYHLFVKNCQFHSQTVFQPFTYAMSKDGMSKDVAFACTLKAGVIAL